VPLYHCFGMVMGNLGCVSHGATMVYPGEAFEPLAVLQAIAEEKCVALYGVPTMFIATLAHPDFGKFDLTSLRTGIMAGSPCPIEVMKQVIDRCTCRGDHRLRHDRDLAGQLPVGCDDSLERRVSTVGRVQPHLEVKVVDEAGRIVPRGQSGELCTRGYSVMLGYWDDPERPPRRWTRPAGCTPATSACSTRTATATSSGRIKDMVIRGGENVYPREIEEFLYRHPAIQDVQVIGVPIRSSARSSAPGSC
jgi:fatty-acyl-CoA synthase